MTRSPLLVLVVLLALGGLSLFLYKWQGLHLPLRPDERLEHWSVEMRLDFLAEGGAVKITLQLPPKNERFPLLEESFISRDYGLVTEERDGRRFAVWSVRNAVGPQTLYYRFKLLALPRRDQPPLPGSPVIRNLPYEGAQLAAAENHVREIRARSADKGSFVRLLLQSLNAEQRSRDLQLLLGEHPDEARKLEVAQNLLALSSVPTRVIHGLVLEDERRMAPLHRWLEVHDGADLMLYDSERAGARLPENYLPWWAEPDRLLDVYGGGEAEVNFAVVRMQEQGLFSGTRVGEQATNPLLRFSLFSLPISSQLVYRVLLMVPLGAFLIVILRNVIGVQTFGTFMPVLIALAFRETLLLRGVLLFTLVVAVGLALRFLLEKLKLLLVPRLAAVLTVVVLIISALSIVSHLLDLQAGLSVALFPMVILTMTIERMSVVWEERGPAEAVKQGIGSMGAAVVAYLVMINDLLEYLLFAFPELLLVVLAVTLLLGRYTGYRLLELPRFRALAREGD